MLKNYDLRLATELHVLNGGVNKVGEIAKEHGAKKIMLVADPGIRKTGIPAKVAESIKAAGIEYIDYDKLDPDPHMPDCEEGARIAMKEGIDFIVAVGGGSSIDVGKSIAALVGHGYDDFHKVMAPNVYTCDPLPMIAVPTTAGSGSEVSIFAVIGDPVTHIKECIADLRCSPTVAVCDPEVLLGLPNIVAGPCAMDALTHAVEAYVCRVANPLTDAWALWACKTIFENIHKYIENRDLECCENIMNASLLAGLAFGYSDVASIHSIGEVVGGLYPIPHGTLSAMFLPDVTEYCLTSAPERYAQLAKAAGIECDNLTDLEAGQAFVDEIRKLNEFIGVKKLKDFVPDDSQFDLMTTRCVEHACNIDNPLVMNKQDFEAVLKKVYEG